MSAQSCPFVAGIDQVRDDAQVPRRTLHRTLEQVSDAELLADLLPVARGEVALVLLDAGVADDFQVRDFCEIGQDLVLHAIGEKGVLLFALRFSKGRTAMLFSGTV